MRTIRPATLARVAALLALAAALPAAPSRAQDAPPPKGAAPAAADDAALAARRADAYLKGLADAGLFSGTVLLARGGQVVLDAASGKADVAKGADNRTSTKFKLMSVSKALTAVAVLRLIQDGKLGLEDPVAKHLEGWPAAWGGVTVHHLLEHTSGVPNLDGDWAAACRDGGARGLAVWRTAAARLGTRALVAPVGTRAAYSNFNFVLAALVVEAVAKRPFEDAFRKLVLEPAGMKDTCLDDGSRRPGLAQGYFLKDGAPDPRPQDMSTIRGAGDVISTTGDLWKLDRALRGTKVLDEATRTLMHTPTQTSPWYACGWMLRPMSGRPCIHHSGGANGYVADFLRFPAEDACVIILSNYAYAPIARMADDLGWILFGREGPATAPASAGTLDAVRGAWRGDRREDKPLVLRRSGKLLLAFEVDPAQDRHSGLLLLPLGDRAFLWPWGFDRIVVAPGADGKDAAVSRGVEGAERPLARWDGSAAWKAAVGEYLVTAPRAEAARIARSGDALDLQFPDGYPQHAEVVPADDGLGLVMISDDFATALRLDRDASGAVTGFRWRRADGTLVEARRR